MIKNFLNKIFFLLFLIILFNNAVRSDEFKNEVDKYFSGRILDSIEGIWIKTYANQGPPGCITMFFKTEKDLYNQIHIKDCFVLNKITGIQSRLDAFNYEGKNAVYYYDGTINWGISKIILANDLKTLEISHTSNNNSFTEKWKRIWPANVDVISKILN